MSHLFSLKPVSMAGAVLVSALTLAACGSGGGSSGGETGGGGTVATTAEGFWAGPTTITTTNEATPRRATMAGSILENGEYWFLLDLGGTIFGMVYGKGTSTAGTFATAQNLETPLQATYVAKTSLKGSGFVTIEGNRGPYQYELAYDSTYDQPPSFNIAGTDWVGSLPLAIRAPFNITITPSGGLTGTSTDDCRLDGTLVPRPGSKRVYNASLTASAACTRANVPVKFTGVAEPTSNQGGTLKQRVLIKTIDETSQSIPLVILVDR